MKKKARFNARPLRVDRWDLAWKVYSSIAVPKYVSVAAGDLRVEATFQELDLRVGQRSTDTSYKFPARGLVRLESEWLFRTKREATRAAAEVTKAGARAKLIPPKGTKKAPAKKRSGGTK